MSFSREHSVSLFDMHSTSQVCGVLPLCREHKGSLSNSSIMVGNTGTALLKAFIFPACQKFFVHVVFQQSLFKWEFSAEAGGSVKILFGHPRSEFMDVLL